jgi:hypothetical protein
MVIAGGHSIIEVASAQLAEEIDQRRFPKDTLVEKISNIDPYVAWGDDNLLPTRIIKEIGKDEVVFRSNEFNKATHIGAGFTYAREIRTKEGSTFDFTPIPEVDEWMEDNDCQRLLLEFVEDYETLGNIVPTVVLSKNRKSVARILRKQMSWCRWEKQNPKSRLVENVYVNADWESYKAFDNIIIPVLDVNFPVDDLLSKGAGFEFVYRLKPIASGRYYYDMANVEVLMNSGAFEIRDMVKAFHKSRLKNGLGAAFHIRVTNSYLETRVKPDQIDKLKTDPEFRRSVLKTIKDEIDKWLSGPDNQGKTLITTDFREQLKNGYEYVSGVTITKIDTSLQVDGWITSTQQMQAQNFLAMGVDPSTIGISNQKDGMNSGSEKKNAFYNSQATMHIDRVNTLAPFYFAARFNGWTKKYPGFKWIIQDTPIISHGNSVQPNNKTQNANS